jgi:hypothetical protein
MTKKKICLYCSASVPKTDIEGVCKDCHKVNDEQVYDNPDDEEYLECVFCGCEIDSNDCAYVDGEGSSCYDCARYCDKCELNHYYEDVNTCDKCGINTCETLIDCSDCGIMMCEECKKEHKCKLKKVK